MTGDGRTCGSAPPMTWGTWVPATAIVARSEAVDEAGLFAESRSHAFAASFGQCL